MKLFCVGHSFRYELENLIRVFLPGEKVVVCRLFRLVRGARGGVLRPRRGGRITASSCLTVLTAAAQRPVIRAVISGRNTAATPTYTLSSAAEAELAIAKLVYVLLRETTGYTPPWGLLTGVRPSKLMLKLRREMGSIAAYRDFTNRLWVTPAKAALAAAVAAAEEPLIEMTRANTFSLYVGIPFCPTRCSYCSFVSHSIGTPEAKKLIAPYLEKLEEEICRTAEIADRLGLQLASVYIGGGTPTTLSAEQLERLLKQITACFGAGAENEFTVEAGRPDTITREKLDALRGKRISINPQTMHDSVLEAIGRKHTAVLAVECYHMAREMGFTQINMDLIAGLPTDTAEGFADSVRQVAALRPENVTVHTLALKRSSVLKATADPFRGAQEIAAMLQSAEETLSAAGYRPYYMYRQSASLGNFENIGRTLPGHICRYNIDMMEETHTILACGAGAVTKLVGQTHAEDEPSGPPLLRVFNYKYPYEYISRFGELMERKKQITDFYLTR